MTTTRILIISQAVMALVLGLTVARTFASGGTDALANATALGSGFTFQGRLEIDGVPANGPCSLEFRLFDSVLNGQQIGAMQPISLTVTNGQFTALLNNGGEFGATPFTGDERWLQVGAGCGSPVQQLAGRTLLTPVPYALSLRPGAQISGATTAPALSLNNPSQLGVGLSVAGTQTGVFISNPSTGVFIDSPIIGVQVFNATVDALRIVGAGGIGVQVFNSGGDGLNVLSAGGDGIDATSDAAAQFAGRFVNSASGGTALFAKGGTGTNVADLILGGSTADPVGRIRSDPSLGGSDLSFFSNDQIFLDFDAADAETGNVIVRNGATEVFEIKDNGNLRQADGAFGLPKFAAELSCGTTTTLTNFRTTRLSGVAPTLSFSGPGECSIDLGFDASSSYVSITASASVPRSATYTTINAGTVLNIFRWNAATGAPASGQVSVIIY